MRRRTSTRWAAVVVAALVLGVLGLAPASAVPTWLPGEGVSGPGFSYTLGARIAVDRFGNATAVWYRSAAGVGAVQGSRRPAGGTWSAPFPISDPARYARNADVVVDGAGTVTAAWVAAGPGNVDQIEWSRLPLGGSWTAPSLVGLGGTLGGVRLAVDDAGAVSAVWTQFRTGAYVVRTSTLSPGGGWSIGQDLSDPTLNSINPQVAVDGPSGAAAAVWQTFDGTYSLIYASRRPAGGAWSSRQLVSAADQDADPNPQVTVGPSGFTTAIFGKYAGGVYEARVTSAPTGFGWSEPLPVSGNGHGTNGWTLTSTRAGETVAAWGEIVDGKSVVQAAVRPAAGVWGPALPLSDPASPSGYIDTGTAPDGSAYLTWFTSNTLQLSRRPPGASWSAPVPVATDVSATPDRAHSLGADDDGDLAVVYTGDASAPQVIGVRALDAAGPVVTTAVPATATAGTSAAFSATASDHWSAVASYAWSFGDGTTATGPSVAHTFATPQAYTVTLTVTDAVGNATTRTATTTVAAPTPAIGTFKLTRKKIGTDQKTKLKVALNTAATLKVVLKSKHQHLVKGKKKYLRVVLRRQLGAGTSKVTIKGKKLKPDTWRVVGTATNTTGASPRKKAKLVVTRP